MDKSVALGFYVRYPNAVDAILECETDTKEAFKESALRSGLPNDLIKVALEQWNTIVALEEELENDRKKFEAKIRDGVLKRLKNKAKWESKSNAWWGWKVKVQLTDGREARPYSPALLGWRFGTYGQKVYVNPWVWARGGRATEKRIQEWLKKWASGLTPKTAESLKWDSGTVMLAEFDCGDYVDEPAGSLDVRRLADDVVGAFAWMTKVRIERILKLGKRRNPRAGS